MAEPLSKRPPQDPLEESLEASKPWWQHHSTHGEFPWSSVISLVLHLFIILLVIGLAAPLLRQDRTPPAVDVLYVGEDVTAAAGDSEEPPGDDVMESTFEDSSEQPPDEMETTELEEVSEPDPVDVEIEVQDVGTELREEEDAVRQAQSALQQAKDALARNLGQKSKSPGGGGGGSGPTGRAARPARWILNFNIASPTDYLRQLDGLGATVAFPLSGDEWLYFYNVSSSNPTSKRRTLANENRLYWVNDNASSVASVARELGVQPTPLMAAFLPLELEERMLKLELAHNNLEEDEIASTQFEVVRRGGKYDVVVSHQIPK